MSVRCQSNSHHCHKHNHHHHHRNCSCTGPTGQNGSDGPTGPTGYNGLDGQTGPYGNSTFSWKLDYGDVTFNNSSSITFNNSSGRVLSNESFNKNNNGLYFQFKSSDLGIPQGSGVLYAKFGLSQDGVSPSYYFQVQTLGTGSSYFINFIVPDIGVVASSGYYKDDIFSMYSDGSKIYAYKNGELMSGSQNPAPLQDTNPEYLYINLSKSLNVTFNEIFFYPTGAQGAQGPTGPKGISNIPDGTNYSDYLFWDGTGYAVGQESVHLGSSAGQFNQTATAIAIGFIAGSNDQGYNSIAIGQQAGQISQGDNAISIGRDAGIFNQKSNAIAIGQNAGSKSQSSKAIAIGYYSGSQFQNENAIAIGDMAGNFQQGQDAIAIGNNVGTNNQGERSVAIGYNAGKTNQGQNCIAIGNQAGNNNQPEGSIILNTDSLGLNATNQGFYVKPVRALSDVFLNPLGLNNDNEIIVNEGSLGINVNLNVNNNITVNNDVIANQKLICPNISGIITIANTGGIATSTIFNANVLPTSLIFLTQRTEKGNYTDYWVANVINGQFDIISNAISTGGEVTFNYLILN